MTGIRVACFVAVLGLAACGDEGGGGGHSHDELAAACDHFEYGPIVAYTADPAGDLPDISLPHHRYDLTLAETAGGQREAVLRYEPTEATLTWFLSSADVPLALTTADGAPLELERAPASDIQCDVAASALGRELPAGAYRLRVGPTSLDSVRLVVHAIAAHGHD